MTIKSFILYVQLHPEEVTKDFYLNERKECTYCAHSMIFFWTLEDAYKKCKNPKRQKIYQYKISTDTMTGRFICDQFITKSDEDWK